MFTSVEIKSNFIPRLHYWWSDAAEMASQKRENALMASEHQALYLFCYRSPHYTWFHLHLPLLTMGHGNHGTCTSSLWQEQVFPISFPGGGPLSQSPDQYCAETASGKARCPGQMRSGHLAKHMIWEYYPIHITALLHLIEVNIPVVSFLLVLFR